MSLMLASAAFALALVAAAAMGLALQRGGTCTVAAMEEWVLQRRLTRARALLEAAAWVAAGLLLAQALGLQPALPAAPAPGLWTLVGAALLGLGALVNGACVFGAVARLGSGEWAYLGTPVGFYVGCLTVPIGVLPSTTAPGAASGLWQLPPWALALVGLAALLRLGMLLAAVFKLRRHGAPWAAAWSPQAATASIGVSFLLLLLLAGAWAYTDVLLDLSRQMAQALPDSTLATRLTLAAALLAGALFGGWATGRWQHRRPTLTAVARCLAGGWLLACGTLLAPGGNDSLILLGLPLLWPHAWLSVVVMCAVIGGILSLQRARAARGTLGAQRGGRSQT